MSQPYQQGKCWCRIPSIQIGISYLSVCLSICLSFFHSIYHSFILSIILFYLAVHLSVHTFPYIHPSIYLFIYLSFCLSIYLSIRLCICLCLYAHLSVHVKCLCVKLFLSDYYLHRQGSPTLLTGKVNQLELILRQLQYDLRKVRVPNIITSL